MWHGTAHACAHVESGRAQVDLHVGMGDVQDVRGAEGRSADRDCFPHGQVRTWLGSNGQMGGSSDDGWHVCIEKRQRQNAYPTQIHEIDKPFRIDEYRMRKV